MMRYVIAVAASAALIAVFFLSPMSGMVITVQRPAEYDCKECNVIFITVDTLRADHVSYYGYPFATTPNIDALAEEGIVFTSAYSQIPHTPPSHWSMFTGLYPFRHGRYMPKDNGTGLTTLPGLLSAEGYVTAAFTSSRMLSGFSPEFDYFNWHPDMRKEEMFTKRTATETTGQALSWLDNHSAERFFLWIHYFDPHSPYNPPEEHDVFDYAASPFYSDSRYDILGISRARSMREEISRYDGEIRYTDDAIGRVFTRARELGLWSNTIFIIMADHGECFGEHNFSDFGYDDDRPCVFHGKTLYDEEVHIPMIIINPSSGYGGARIGAPVESVDIFSTILEMLGVEVPESDGESLVHLITSGNRTKGYVFMQTKPLKNLGFSLGILKDGWKFLNVIPSELYLESETMEQEEGFMVSVEVEGDVSSKKTIGNVSSRKMLFRQEEGEKTNLFVEEESTDASLESLLMEILPATDAFAIGHEDEDTARLLRSLGYMD